MKNSTQNGRVALLGNYNFPRTFKAISMPLNIVWICQGITNSSYLQTNPLNKQNGRVA